MKALGFFAERDGGALPGPSLHDALRDPLPEPEREVVAGYLRAGSVLAATPSRQVDILDPDAGAVLPEHIRTDGEYLWPEDLAHYVRTYGARPSRGFLERVALIRTPPALDANALTALMPAAREAMERMRAASGS